MKARASCFFFPEHATEKQSWWSSRWPVQLAVFHRSIRETHRYLRRIDEISPQVGEASSRSTVARRGVKTLSVFRDSLIRITPNLPVVFGIPRSCHTSERIPLSSFRQDVARRARPITGTKDVKRI